MTSQSHSTLTLAAPGTFLRRVLLADAATGLATGTLMSSATATLSGLTLIAPPLLYSAGLSLFPIAAFMAYVAMRFSRLGVWLVILGNVGWALGSIALLVGGVIAPNALGAAFVVLQALAVAVFAGLEVLGLRRLPSA